MKSRANASEVRKHLKPLTSEVRCATPLFPVGIFCMRFISGVLTALEGQGKIENALPVKFLYKDPSGYP